MDKDFGIILQVRLGSTRLPNKMLLPFYNEKSLLQIIVENLISIFPKENLIIATTNNPIDDKLVESLGDYELNIFRGDENNVLKRFIDAAAHYQLKSLMRICGDNPFLLNKYLLKLLDVGLNSNADYLAYFYQDGLPSIKSHNGFFAEWVKVEALKKVVKLTEDKLYLEHVTNYIYAHPETFKVDKINIPKEDFCRKIRLTIDTKTDLETSIFVYDTLKKNGKSITLKNIEELLGQYPELLLEMSKIIKEQKK